MTEAARAAAGSARGALPPYSAAVSAGPSPRLRGRVPRIGDLIDLELALEHDRERPIEMLLARDARIAGEIEVATLGDRALVLAWLDRVRPSPDSPGRAGERLLGLTGLLLATSGLFAGVLAVSGWLWSGTRTPVNVVQLWPSLVGVQLVLVALWIALRFSSHWLPHPPEHGLSTWLPAALGTLLARLQRPGLRDAWRRFRTLDRIYSGLTFWRITALTQSFAVAFNVGALAALLFIPTVDDPAFGWRSRLIDAGEMHAVARVVAAPWSRIWPEALPTSEEVEATEHSSLAPGDASPRPGRSPVWAAWWPFLVASFVVYGLLPRLLLRVAAGWRTRALLRDCAFDHEGCVRLRERLRRPVVDGRAERDERSGAHVERRASEATRLELPGEVRVVRWAGVPLEADGLSLHVARALGVGVESVESAGGLDVAGDAAAIEKLRGARAALVVVEAWEPPSADYLDFLRKLRSALETRAPLLVLPCEVDASGRPTPVEPRHLALWRRGLAGLSDPWLRVEPFPTETS